MLAPVVVIGYICLMLFSEQLLPASHRCTIRASYKPLSQRSSSGELTHVEESGDTDRKFGDTG